MTDSTTLSPAAQAVLDAYYEAYDAYSEHDPPPQLAAALRAAASRMEFVQDVQHLHNIATELESQP